jgi:hypothetical protein
LSWFPQLYVDRTQADDDAGDVVVDHRAIGGKIDVIVVYMGRRRLSGPACRAFLESGETLSDLRRTGAFIRQRKHICAPSAP